MPGTIEFTIALRTVSETNVREHWMSRHRRRKMQRQAAHAATLQAVLMHGRPSLPAKIRLTRLGKRALDSDNLASSCKAVRDGVADAIGIDDGCEDAATWSYEQQTGAAWEVRVCISPRDEKEQR